jgi:biotin carboxyl carrier protein
MKSYSLIINGKKYKTTIKGSTAGQRIVEVNGDVYEVVIEGEKEAIEARKAAVENIKKESIPTYSGSSKKMTSAEASTHDILSPIPGLILEIMVKEGDKVAVGDILLKMEAMKMENEIKSTRNGTVTKIYVNKADSVLEGQQLICVE